MERPGHKRQRSPPVQAPYSSRQAQDNGQRPPYVPRNRSPLPSRNHGSRPLSPLAPRPRSPRGSRPLSPLMPRSRLRPPANTRPRSPFVPRARSRSPHNIRPRSPVLPRSRSPAFALGLRSPPRLRQSTHSPYVPRPRSPHNIRPRSPVLPMSRSPAFALGLRSPPRLRQSTHSPSLRGREPSPASHRRPSYREDPNREDLRHRLIRRHSGDHRERSPINLRDKTFVEKSLKITVGNDFYSRCSLEQTKLYDALDNVSDDSDDSREDFVDECILPGDLSLPSLKRRSDEVQRLSPLNIRNDVDYRRDASSRPFQENLSRLDTDLRSYQGNSAAMPKMPSQHEDFRSSCGFDMERSSLTKTQDPFNPFSFNADNFWKDFLKNDAAGTVYQNLERPTEQDLYVLLSEGILADKRKRCNDLGQQDTLLQKQDNPFVKADSQEGSRTSHNMSMINMPGVQEKLLLNVEDSEEFLYGNAGNVRDETHPSARTHSITQKGMGGVMEATQEQSNLEHSEFGKIQDLLKTIGLEIGAAEMGKLSVRTRERLYGKNLPSKFLEHHSTEAQIQDAANVRNRSSTRSPELDQKFPLSPAWSLRTSTDRLSHSKSEFSVNENDGGHELPGSPTGQEPSSPLIAQEPCNLSLRQEPANTSSGQEFQITVLGRPTSYNYAALPSPVMPTPITPHQMTNCAPYTSAHMLQGTINSTSPRATLSIPPPAFPPCSPILPPPFFPNINIPPPPVFPQYPVPGYAPYATSHVTQNVGIPAAPTTIGYQAYGNVMPNTKSDFKNSMAQFTQDLPLNSNLKVIQTVNTANSKVTYPAKPIKSASTHLVYVQTKDSPYKITIPTDDNRVAQRLKVLRDLEKLKSDRAVRGKKLDFLQKKLETLNNRHGEILQTKAQQNNFHTNPLLQQAKRIENELLNLCKEAEKADEQQSSLEKVAKILGLNISEKSNQLAENKNRSMEDKHSSTAKSSTPIEVKTQTQVGNSTSS